MRETRPKTEEIALGSLAQDLADRDARRRAHFMTFLRWVQRVTLLSAMALVFIGYVIGPPQLVVWGGSTSLYFLFAAISSQRAKRPEQLNSGVYLFAGAMFVILLLNSLFLSGLLPLILVGNLAAVTLVGFYASPHLVVRMTVVGFVFAALAVLLEGWAPFSPPDASDLATVFALVAFVFAGFIIHMFGDILNKTLITTQGYASELEQSQTDLVARTQELEATAADLAARREELQTTYGQVEKAARQGQQRSTLLHAIVEVSRAVTQIHDPDRLLPQITQLISQYFGYYHVGIFLLDETGRSLTLRAANSSEGWRMVGLRYKVALGTEGIVNYVMSTSRSRIALDTGDDIYFNNPNLPDTCSQVALPLFAGQKVVGVLDVHSTQKAAFDEEDISMLVALSDQVAIAMENARIFQENQAALAQAQEVYRRYVRQEWDGFLRPGHAAPTSVREGQTIPGAPRSSAPDTAREVREY